MEATERRQIAHVGVTITSAAGLDDSTDVVRFRSAALYALLDRIYELLNDDPTLAGILARSGLQADIAPLNYPYHPAEDDVAWTADYLDVSGRMPPGAPLRTLPSQPDGA